MAYVPIDPAALDVESVIQSSTHVQINENAEDTRTKMLVNTAAIAALNFGLVKLMYRKSFDFTVDVTKGGTTSYVEIELDEPITNEVLTPATADDFIPISNDKLDFSSFKFGDNVKVAFNFTSGFNVSMIFKIGSVEKAIGAVAGMVNNFIEIEVPITEESQLIEAALEAKVTSGSWSVEISDMSLSINIG